MKRTLMAVGIAVLLSLSLVPHGGSFNRNIRVDNSVYTHGHYYKFRAPFWESYAVPVLTTELVEQTFFLSIVAAIIVNIRWSRRILRWLLFIGGSLLAAAGIFAAILFVAHGPNDYAGYLGLAMIGIFAGSFVYWCIRQYRSP